MKHNFLFLESNVMSLFTLNEIQHLENVRIINSSKVSESRIVCFFYKIHNSLRLRKYINIPFKSFWFHYLFDRLFESFIPNYVVMSYPWYSHELVSFLKKRAPKCIILLRFTDKVDNSLKGNSDTMIKDIEKWVDGVLVYSKEDEAKYGYKYLPVGYSKIDVNELPKRNSYDVVFIGANKGRLDKIKYAYNMFRDAGLSCFFYVTGVEKKEQTEDGIQYADSNLDYYDYLSYEVSAKCLFEIVQDGTSGRTYRLAEAVIYNKLLITNCREIKGTRFFDDNNVLLFNDVAEINPSFVSKRTSPVDYQYKGEFSPIRDMEFIENTWE